MTPVQQPRVWILLDDRPGHRTQVVGLAERLGWSFDARKLSFNRLNKLPNPILGASLHSVDRSKSDALTPPFPDVVIAMGRRCVPVARWIRRMSEGRCRLVQIGRKGVTAADEFSLLISCAHFNMPPHARRRNVPVPPSQVTDERLAEARDMWAEKLAERQKPHIVLLVGGDSALHAFPADYAVDVLKRAEAATESLRGSLTVVTSRRTSSEAVQAMQSAATSAMFEIWDRSQARNPYLGYLAWADGLIVTGESESMLAESVATGKPLHIVAMPEKRLSPMKQLKRRLTYRARGQDLSALVCSMLFNQGWMTPYRDLDKMHDAMCAAGLAHPFETALDLTRPSEDTFPKQIMDELVGLLSSTSARPADDTRTVS